MAANAQGGDPIFDFPVVSNDDAPKEPKPPDEWTETVWKEDPPPESWKRGKRLGTVEIQALGGTPGSPRFKATFTFDDHPDQKTEVEGAVPGGDRWVGKGRAKARGPKPEKDVPIEFKNPKRWG